MKTGVIGLGAMGAGMAHNLYRAGYLQAVWNRTESKARQFAIAHPIMVATTPAALAQHCELILISVSRDQDLLDIIEQLLPGLRADNIVIDTSTVSPDTARQAAAVVSTTGAEFLDAPVSGGVEGARNAKLAMMIGGLPETLARAEPVLQTIAARIVHMGPVGSGQATKAVNQIMVAGINQAVTEALAFGEALQLPMDKVIEVISQGAAGNWFLAQRGATMLQGKFEPGFKVALHHKDLALCKAIAEQLGAQLPVVEMTLIHYKRLIEAGYGEADTSALFRQKQELFGVKP